MASQADWYYSRGGTQSGPVPIINLRDMIARGQLTPDDLVWSEGMSSWLAIRQVPVLQAMLASAPAPGFSPAPASPLDAMAAAQPQFQQQYGAPQPQQQYPAPGYGYAAAPYGTPNYGYQQMAPSSQGLAIAGMICSIFMPLIGLILSIVALVQMNSSGNREGRGFAIAGMVISLCWMVGLCMIGIFAAAMSH